MDAFLASIGAAVMGVFIGFSAANAAITWVERWLAKQEPNHA